MSLYQGKFEIEGKYGDSIATIRVFCEDTRKEKPFLNVAVLRIGHQANNIKFYGTGNLMNSLPTYLRDTGIEFNVQELYCELAKMFLYDR